ncbi:holliday junction DNA helicase ruvB family protein [Helicobacter pylori SouthAfrica50]|uniref:Holliday junction DNA helicase ruvB family protein n=1 Tax=Helicobacter pylori SouthAfrica50 TaxID=1352357 RepID=T2SA50_HELPX|nr:holliday junction DNA helicase ruvB family protein [Helicobacter pylori SouthAfrica50]
MKERIVNLETLDFETSQEVSLRPDLWEDFIGQEKIKNNLQISICAAKKRQESLDHMLFLVHRVWVKPLLVISSLKKWKPISKLPPLP